MHWKITDYCNFECPGCSGHSIKIDSTYVPQTVNLDHLDSFLKGLNKKIRVVISGGEPTLIENIVDVCKLITQKNNLILITNAASPKIKEIADQVNRKNVEYIKTSAHIRELEKNNLLDTFFDHVNYLQKRKIAVSVEEVAYPFMAPKAQFYRDLFAEHGIRLSFQAYRGGWEEKNYPDAYDPEDYQIFNFDPIGRGEKQMHYRKGRLCNAGYNVIVAYGESIHRCYGLYETRLGDFKSGVKLMETMKPCPLEYCDCPFPVFEKDLFEKALKQTGQRK